MEEVGMLEKESGGFRSRKGYQILVYGNSCGGDDRVKIW